MTLLIDDIEAGFERNDECGAVFIDLSAAYDTVWHRGLTLKLNNVIPDKSLVNFIMTMIASRSFTWGLTGANKDSSITVSHRAQY